MAEFVMPSLGADMEAGTLVKWRVAEGDTVARGDIVAEVDTDKGVIEIECFEPGVVAQLIAEPGEKLPVGTVMAVIRGAGEPAAAATGTTGAAAAAVSPTAAPAPSTVAPPTPAPAVAGVVEAATAPAATGARRASPRARRRAEQLGIDLATVPGTGPDGAIEVADVERMAASHPISPSPMRRAIAAAMAKSKREIPHYYLETRVDMSRALAWLRSENEQRSVERRLLPAVVLLKAVARALAAVPELNGFWIDDAFRPGAGIHIGMAIAMKGGGLVAPALHDVDARSYDELMADLHDLIPRARAGRLRSSEMTDPTITVTSLGDLGADSVLGIIYPPQVALVGFGRIREEPWAEGGRLEARPVARATLAGDHRATDGLVGARFLDALARHLQSPEAS